MDISFGLDDTHVLITGGAGLIGREVVNAFVSAGANVTSMDLAHPNGVQTLEPRLITIRGDTTSASDVSDAFRAKEVTWGPVKVCITLGALDLSVLAHHASAADMSVEQFSRTLDVNVTGTFLVAREWLRTLRTVRQTKPEDPSMRNVSLILVGSESGHWGERTNCDYGASKAAVQFGLLQSLRQDAPKVYPGARVNAVAPGPVNTARFKEECAANPSQYYEDAGATTALGRPVEPEDVARTMLFLASERYSRSIHGQILNVDSGKLGKLVNIAT